MLLSPSFDTVLKLIAGRLEGTDFPWAITGGVGMRLQGMALEPKDIDLQCSADDAYKLQAFFSEFVTLPVFFKASERIRSHFGAMEINGVTVEIMGDMEKLLPDGTWEPAPDLPAVTRWVPYENLRLPVLDLEYEYISYQHMGREAKAELIRAFLDRQPHE